MEKCKFSGPTLPNISDTPSFGTSNEFKKYPGGFQHILNFENLNIKLIFSSVQSLNRFRLFVTPWITALQASLSITNSWSLPKPMSIELGMPSNDLIVCCPLFLLPSIFQHQGLLKWVSSSHQVAKVLEFQLQHQSFQWTPRTDLL